MPRFDNYPDDIRSFDNDPRSPFYVQPAVECAHCGDMFDLDDGFESEINGETLCSQDCVDGYELDNFGCDGCDKLESECECD